VFEYAGPVREFAVDLVTLISWTRNQACSFGFSRSVSSRIVVNKYLVLALLLGAFVLSGCDATHSNSSDCRGASCMTYDGVELSISHVDRNYILATTKSSTASIGAGSRTLTVATVPLPSVSVTPKPPPSGGQPGSSVPSSTAPPPAAVSVPAVTAGFHYIRP
jgi:hypothetical protein